jgi:hypothetical protein
MEQQLTATLYVGAESVANTMVIPTIQQNMYAIVHHGYFGKSV